MVIILIKDLIMIYMFPQRNKQYVKKEFVTQYTNL